MVTLTVCMIVKNEQEFLENALKSIAPLADEIIIVDTGSTDNTKHIASKYTPKVYDFIWNNNFAQARNFSTSKASSDWIFVLDSDEAINPLDIEEIKTTVTQAPQATAAFTFTRRNYTEKPQGASWKSSEGDIYPESKVAPGYFEDDLIRLFRNNRNIIFEGKIHETVTASARDAGSIDTMGVPIHHYGHLRNSKDQKRQLYEQLYNLQEQQSPSAQIFWEHGRDLLAQGHTTKALSYFIKSVNQDKTFFPGWLSMANAYMIRGDNFRAKVAFAKAHKLDPNHYFIYLGQGILLTTERDFSSALDEFMHALTLDPKNATVHYYIGICLHAKGDKERASLAFQNACDLNPSYKEKIKFE